MIIAGSRLRDDRDALTDCEDVENCLLDSAESALRKVKDLEVNNTVFGSLKKCSSRVYSLGQHGRRSVRRVEALPRSETADMSPAVADGNGENGCNGHSDELDESDDGGCHESISSVAGNSID